MLILRKMETFRARLKAKGEEPVRVKDPPRRPRRVKRRRPPPPHATSPLPRLPPGVLFELDIITRQPTEDELSEMAYLARTPYFSHFILPTAGAAVHPTSVGSLHALMVRDPSILRWPLVVFRPKGLVSIGGRPSVVKLLHNVARWCEKRMPRETV
jgi:hypothetical protein